MGSLRPPETFATARLRPRPMGVSDTADMFRYASDPAATRFMNFPRHRAIGDCEAFAGEPAGDSLAYAAIRADPM